MTWFPKIERICPVLDRLDQVMDGDACRMCKRQVHDLSGMGADQCAAFVAARDGDVCISYAVRLNPAMAAAALAAGTVALLAPGSAMAQRHDPIPSETRPARVPDYALYVTGGAPPVIDMPPIAEPPLPPAQPEPPREPARDESTVAGARPTGD